MYGVCANPLPGLVRISASSSDQQSENFKEASAVCPAGKAMVGTGFLIGPGFGIGGVTVGRVRPLGLSSVTRCPSGSRFKPPRPTPTPATGTLTAYAICATQPAGLRVYRAVSARQPGQRQDRHRPMPTGQEVDRHRVRSTVFLTRRSNRP